MTNEEKGIHTGTFKLSDLVLVDESRHVIHATGGPIMNAVAFEGENTLCEWISDGQVFRHLFLAVCLRRLVKYETAAELEAAIVKQSSD